MVSEVVAVLVRLGVAGGRRQVSSLRSLRGLLERVYPSLLDEGNEQGQVGENAVSPLIAADCMLQLLQPFTAHLHDQFTNNMVLYTPTDFHSYSPLLLLRLLCRPSGHHSRESVPACMSLLHCIAMAIGSTPSSPGC